MDIIEGLRKYLDDNRLSVPVFATKSGIPQARIYKWLAGEGSPKADDSATLEQILNTEPMNEHKKNGSIAEPAFEPPHMREFLDYLKGQNTKIMNVMEYNFSAISSHLAVISSHLDLLGSNSTQLLIGQQLTEAHAKASLQWEAMKLSAGDLQKQDEVLNTLNKLVFSNLPRMKEMGNQTVESNSSKA